MKLSLFLCLIIKLNVLMAVEYLPLQEHDVPNPAKHITYDDRGNWLEVTVNEWKDRVKTDEGVQSYIYNQGYNYQKQLGFLRVFTLDHQLVSEEYSVDYDGMVAREEMLLAYELIKKDPTVDAVFKQQSETIELQGGFNYADSKSEQVCSKGMRCVHVFANTPTKALILHAIVKLSDKTVPYPLFDTNTIIQKRKQK